MFRKLSITTRDPLASLGLLVLRVGIAFSLAMLYGHPKWMGWPDASEGFFDPYGLGPTTSFALVMFAEYACAVLVGLGLFTRLATVPILVAMATATWVFQADTPFINHEKSYMYFIVFLVLLIAGPGRFSLDAAIRRRR